MPNNIQKHFFYKVYTDTVLVETWVKEVLTEPKFRNNINNSAGELVLQLGRPFDDFGEDVDVRLNNQVDCYVVDKDNPNGLLLYSGYISGYRPVILQAKEYVEITVFSYASQFGRMILRDGSGNTTLTYNSYDPAVILRDIIDKYQTVLGGTVRYTATSIQNTNTVVTYEFNTNTVKEAIDKIVELCPEGWYWRVDPDNTIYLKPKNILADHTFSLGLEVENLETFRRIEDVVNRVLFTGAGDPPLFLKFENTGSQDSYGLYEKKLIDQRVSDSATAQIMASRIINAQKDPEIRSKYQIIDNNGINNTKGYNIESIKPGQTLKIKNLKASTATTTLWNVGLWDQNVWDRTLATAAADVLQILSIQYEPDSIVLEASSRLPQISKRIEDIQRNLENSQTVNNPVAPS